MPPLLEPASTAIVMLFGAFASTEPASIKEPKALAYRLVLGIFAL